MSFIILHATAKDIDSLRLWLNDAEDLAWIVKTGQSGRTHHWRAVRRLDLLDERQYALWHIPSGPLNIPSGDSAVQDAFVTDPFTGWSQSLDGDHKMPWFGANLPGPYSLELRLQGREQPGSIGRSTFYWALDRYKLIGKPAHPAAKALWLKLRRFVAKSATKLRWPNASGYSTFVFPDAFVLHQAGRHLDVNP